MHIQPIKPNKAESQKELIAYCPSLIPFSASRHPLRIVQLAIKEDSAPLSPSSNRPVRNAARPAPPLLVLISFFTGMLTEKSYYKILIKQCPQTEHKRYQMFAAYWDSGVNTILKTSNFGLWSTSMSFGWKIPWKFSPSDISWHQKFKTARAPKRELKLRDIFATQSPSLNRAFQSLDFVLDI